MRAIPGAVTRCTRWRVNLPCGWAGGVHFRTRADARDALAEHDRLLALNVGEHSKCHNRECWLCLNYDKHQPVANR